MNQHHIYDDNKNGIQRKTSLQLAVEKGNIKIIRLIEENEHKTSSSHESPEDDFLKQLSLQVLNNF